jgi:hypothetical protein
MKKVYVVLLVFCLSLGQTVLGQDSVRHATLSLSVGLNSLRHKDAFESPYTYKGTNLLVNAIYTRTHARGQHVVDVTYAGGTMQAVISPEAKNWSLRLNYDYLVDLKPGSVRGKLSPVLGVGVHTLFSNARYLPEVESSVRYLSGGAYLTLTGGAQLRLNSSSSLSMRAGMAIAGGVYRPDFEIRGKTLTKATWIGESDLFSVDLRYTYAVTRTLDFMAAYQYSYFTFDEPRAIAVLQQGVSVGMRKRF